MLVPVSERELRAAAGQALERRMDWLREGRPERYESGGPEGLGRDFVGAIAEIAVAKHLGRYPGGFAGRGCADCLGVEVRAITKPGAALQVYPSDDAAGVFVLCLVGPDVLRSGVDLVGFVAGETAKDEKFWDASTLSPAFLVPQCWLMPPECLAAWLATYGGKAHG